jgi:hypothetical protein
VLDNSTGAEAWLRWRQWTPSTTHGQPDLLLPGQRHFLDSETTRSTLTSTIDRDRFFVGNHTCRQQPTWSQLVSRHENRTAAQLQLSNNK